MRYCLTLWLWGPNPKCLTASRAFLGPRRRRVFAPVGARSASWSKVRVSPPAFSILALAVAVNRNAATESLGTVRRRLSSVIVPITTMVLPLWASVTLETSRERETGGRLILDIKRRRSTTLLKLDSVRPNRTENSNQPPIVTISKSGIQEILSYGRESGRASQGPEGRHFRSSAPCDGCCAHGDGPGRYLKWYNC